MTRGAIRAFICTATDTDYFSFGVALRDEIRLTLNELPKNYDLELYDPSGTRVRFSTNAGTAAGDDRPTPPATPAAPSGRGCWAPRGSSTRRPGTT